MIRIENLAKRYGPKEILRATTYHFPEGERIALVGPNGAGKTTLLKLLCGVEEADTGQIVVPGDFVVGYLPQVPNGNPAPTVLEECLSSSSGGRLQSLKERVDLALEKLTLDYNEKSHLQFEQLEHEFRSLGGYALEARAKGILTGLGFSAAKQGVSPLSLSGGWRMRLELAKIFLNSPHFLILDEPTNHLDLPSLKWVEKYLAQFQGTLLYVSHDRELLNRLSTVTVFLKGGVLDAYKGNFDSFLVQREERLERDAARADLLRKQQAHLQKFVDRFGAQATKAKQAQSRVKMIEKLRTLEENLSFEDSQEAMSFRLPIAVTSGREVLLVKELSIGYSPSVPLATRINFRVNRGDRVGIIGSNGVGKSTLLKSIVGIVPPLQGEFTMGHNVQLSYFAQDQLDTLRESASVLDNLKFTSGNLSEKELRGLLGGLLFHGDDVFKPVSVLSGGEKSRVGLARVLAQSGNLLLLDEPTNHLDMTSCEILASAVAEYEGTVVFVSHDTTFINEVATHILVILPDGRNAIFEGNLDDYERLCILSNFPNVLAPECLQEQSTPDSSSEDKVFKADSQQQRQEQKEQKRDRQKIERQIKKLEERMEALQTSLQQKESELLACDPKDFLHMANVAQKINAQKAELQEIEEEWLILQD